MLQLLQLFQRPVADQTMVVNKKLIWFFLVVAFIGFADATYLTITHYLQAVPPCLTGGCEAVTTSQYATWGGVPVALVGAIYYFVILLSALLYLVEGWQGSLKIIKYLPVAGLLGSIYFVYLQAFVIGQWCQYCLLSATTSTLLFVGSIWLWRQSSAQDVPDQASGSADLS